MTRIPAREVAIASGAVSAVVSLCLVGAITAAASGTSENAQQSTIGDGPGGAAATGPYSPLVSQSPADGGDRAVIGGSYQGVWFGLRASEAIVTAAADALGAATASPGSPAAAPTSPTAPLAAPPAPPPPAPAPPPATAPPPGPAQAAPAAPPVQQQSRSSAAAAISAGNPREIAQALAATYRWTGNEWTCLDQLWDHESKFQTTVSNPASGAYGIPQALPASKMGSAGADWRTNPVTQIVWGLGYIQDRYGSPCNAWSYWLRHTSY